MKPEKDPDRIFQWDLVTAVIIALAIVFVILVLLDIGPIGHVR